MPGIVFAQEVDVNTLLSLQHQMNCYGSPVRKGRGRTITVKGVGRQTFGLDWLSFAPEPFSMLSAFRSCVIDRAGPWFALLHLLQTERDPNAIHQDDAMVDQVLVGYLVVSELSEVRERANEL
jgi:hypothetical protein